MFILAAYAIQIIVLNLFCSKMHETKRKILNFLKKIILLNIVNRKQLTSSKNPPTSMWWKHLSNSTCIQRTFIWKMVMIRIEQNQHEIYLEWKPNSQVDWVIFSALVSLWCSLEIWMEFIMVEVQNAFELKYSIERFQLFVGWFMMTHNFFLRASAKRNFSIFHKTVFYSNCAFCSTYLFTQIGNHESLESNIV